MHDTEGQVGLTNQDILIEIGAGETGLIEAGRPPIRVLKPPAYVLEVLRLRIDGRPLTQITGGQTASLDQGTRPRGESGVCLP